MDSDSQNSVLHAQFYKGTQQNNHRTQQEGRPIFDTVDMVRVTIPGNSTLIIDTLASDYYKGRFPVQWAHFKATHGEGEAFSGTPLKEWPLLTAGMVEELKHFKFFTVEQVANSSDLQIGSIGMLAGMAPTALRDKARVYLQKASQSAADMALVDELGKRDQMIADLKAQNERQAEQIAAILKKMEEPDKRGPGRPRKETEAA